MNEPTMASEMASIPELQRLLEYGNGTPRYVVRRFETEVRKTLHDGFQTSGMDSSDLLDWRNREHRNLLHTMAIKFVNKHGKRFWGPRHKIPGRLRLQHTITRDQKM